MPGKKTVMVLAEGEAASVLIEVDVDALVGEISTDKEKFVRETLTEELQCVSEMIAGYLSGSIYSGPILLVMVDNRLEAISDASTKAVQLIDRLEKVGPEVIIEEHIAAMEAVDNTFLDSFLKGSSSNIVN